MRDLTLSAVLAVVIIIPRTVAALPQEPTREVPAASAEEDLRFLETAYAARTSAEAKEWRERVQARKAGLTATFERLAAADQGADALRFAVPLAYFLGASNEQAQAYAVLVRALELKSAGAPTAARARALYEAGRYAFRQGDQAQARALNNESLRIARALGDDAAAANALIGLSRVALRDHDFAAVKRFAQDAAALRARLGDNAGERSAMHMIAAASRMEGDDVRAQQIYESTLETYRASGEKRAAAGELFNLGYVHLHQNHLSKAGDLFAEALREYRALNDQAGIAYCLTGYAAVAAVEKRTARAARLYGAAGAALAKLAIKLDPDDQLDWDRYSALAKSQTEPELYASEYQRGAALDTDAAIAFALEEQR